jgi:predicted dehydrogenase
MMSLARTDAPAKRRGGLIGCGYVSQYHLAGWSQQSTAEIVAVCDQDETRVRATAERFRITAAYTSAEEMLARESLDFVEICTRPPAHEPLVNLAARHQLDILCQKPLGTDLASIDRMIAVTTTAGVRCMVHENWRFRPWYVELHKVVHQGVIGNPIRLRINAHDFRCMAPGGLGDQPYFKHMPRFILYEMGPHLVDVARSLFGEPTTVFGATARTGAVDGEDSAHLVLGYADGKQAILDMCWSTRQNPEDSLTWGLQQTLVEGSKGTLRVDAQGQLERSLPDGTIDHFPVFLEPDPRVQAYAGVHRHFLECLETGRPFLTDIADNRKAMAIVYAGYESAERQMVIRLG